MARHLLASLWCGDYEADHWLKDQPGTLSTRSKISLGGLIVHQLDARIPLGAPHVISADRLAWALSYSISPAGKAMGSGSHKLGRDLHFVATDLDWSSGVGQRFADRAKRP